MDDQNMNHLLTLSLNSIPKGSKTINNVSVMTEVVGVDAGSLSEVKSGGSNSAPMKRGRGSPPKDGVRGSLLPPMTPQVGLAAIQSNGSKEKRRRGPPRGSGNLQTFASIDLNQKIFDLEESDDDNLKEEADDDNLEDEAEERNINFNVRNITLPDLNQSLFDLESDDDNLEEEAEEINNDSETAGGSIYITPHVLTVKPGENIVGEIFSFFQKGPEADGFILSAIGTVSSVILQEPAAVSNGFLRYEGPFEILSISGTCTFIGGAAGCPQRKIGRLSVSLAKPDGSVFGGGIENSMIAATPIRLVLGTFKENINN